ncbi:hypothetical protein CPB86DRAFT_733118 [Serendipita vermifera]|nr:hypothetical protein CPB86DRAFT_733118 [Serendipita vermifera]
MTLPENNGPVDERVDTDTEMLTARSQVTSPPYAKSHRSQDVGEREKQTRASYFSEEKDQSDHTFQAEKPATNPSLDLLDRVERMYRLLELVSDKGVSGAVDKVIIAQESIERYANALEPGSYRSVTKVDFETLDNHPITPKGVYGSISALVAFLQDLGRIDQETASLLQARRDESSGITRPSLSAGIYLLDARDVQDGLSYILFWPEDDTWKDNAGSAVARNRVTFMRYLTKLSDQLVCLISDEHAANLVWNEDEMDDSKPDDHRDDDKDMDDRLMDFSVEQTQNQDEGASLTAGFSLQHTSITEVKERPQGYPDHLSSSLLGSKIICGDVAQGILCTSYTAEIVERNRISKSYSRPAMKAFFRASEHNQIDLDENIDDQSLRTLVDLGVIQSLPGKIDNAWKSYVHTLDEKCAAKHAAQKLEMKALLTTTITRINDSLPIWLINEISQYYPSISEEKLILKTLTGSHDRKIDAEFVTSACSQIETYFKNYPDFKREALSGLQEDLSKLEINPKASYIVLKHRFLDIASIISTDELPVQMAQQFVDLLTTASDFDKELKELLNYVNDGSLDIFSWLTLRLWSPKKLKIKYTRSATTQPPMDDLAFWTFLCDTVANSPSFGQAAEAIKSHVIDLLSAFIRDRCQKALKSIEGVLSRRQKQQLQHNLDEQKRQDTKEGWNFLRNNINSALRKHYDKNKPTQKIVRVTRESYGHRHQNNENFQVTGTELRPSAASLRYEYYPFDVKSVDQQALALDVKHVFRPFINEREKQFITLPVDVTLRFFRLIGKEWCLAILEDSICLKVFLDFTRSIAKGVETNKFKKEFKLERVGTDTNFAVDESRRFFALLSRKQQTLQIYMYSYDEVHQTLSARKTPSNISRWYPSGIPKISNFLFVPGSEELLLIDEMGKCRIYSVATETFRSKSLSLGARPTHALTTPDGSCLLIVDFHEGQNRLRCFHWSTFGENSGLELSLPIDKPSFCSISVSAIVRRENMHLLMLDPSQRRCQSMIVNITQKLSAYAFRRTATQSVRKHHRVTSNNSLIDCHAEVWTRFPIHAPITRETNANATKHPTYIHFISNLDNALFARYFRDMVIEFETRTRKPTDNKLRNIQVASPRKWSPWAENCAISQFSTGDWLVGLFCLIPIHIAVTSSNRFVPLKDGINSAEFEEELLGADVLQITQAISFGWYESIFGSYLADKPVKVVSSMGEQSVGKSYTLNHFVDTSFAGSAMRCTEGVWMSVTPTKDYLVVSMDFEGVQSIERSAQEDTLLVLLNTAISNHVLFRNNFVISRDIAGLFTSFQSCISVLDPDSNPSLFQSRLEIIIKDVISSDTEDMAKEFYLKFDRIVQEEGSENFITKLHRGKLGIIPWHVIESPGFYKLFSSLKGRFMKQPVTHKHAGSFIVTLKILMAKLKATDWGALDHNLAAQRAQYLLSSLPSAFSFGQLDPYTKEALKDCDTDKKIPSKDSGLILYLPRIKHPEDGQLLSVDLCLENLRRNWRDHLNRYEMGEVAYIQAYKDFLAEVLKTRNEYVQKWIQVNTMRFPDNPDISNVLQFYEELRKELHLSMIPCGARCSDCGLLCLDRRLHDGTHDCKTNHKCAGLCEFAEQHWDGSIPSCDIPAGHTGRHACNTMSHLCGLLCKLSALDGCMKQCSLPMNHTDGEHMCDAKVHACGAPCDLITPDGTLICPRKCVIDSDRPHERHSCEHALACPIKCQLCNSMCAAGDHFHALQPGAIHLCGQRHRCPKPCEALGICEINNAPQSVESTFVGKYSKFHYTKYTQVANRLPCGIWIEPDELSHEGNHTHTTDPVPFHFCEARCNQCGYYCTHPLGHSQDEHRTKHGSMDRTEWIIEGDDDTFLELQGRKFATGDNGAPMLCSMVCKTQGRHVHISPCRAKDPALCQEGGVEHIRGKKLDKEYDWVSHKHFWTRSGFEDPYTNAERAEFELCDRRCGGEEHDSSINPGAVDSYCTLPLFHGPARPEDTPGLGYISHDGHAFACKNPVLMQKSYHIFFALDRSSSMTLRDRRPLQDTPVSQRISRTADNRFGAVLSSIYGFWVARDAATRNTMAVGVRRDTYTVACDNDISSSPEELLDMVPSTANRYAGTNFTSALQLVQTQLENTWDTDRSPVIIFLSDGECEIQDITIQQLCHSASSRGKPLAFHSVAFGRSRGSRVLRRMAALAAEAWDAVPEDPLLPSGPNPCAFHDAFDTIQLADTFLAIASSLKNPRAALATK